MDWAAVPGAVGARIMLLSEPSARPGHPGIEAILEAGARSGLPINVLCWGGPGRRGRAGPQPPRHPHRDRPPRSPPALRAPGAGRSLGRPGRRVVALAALDNVVVKVTGACTLIGHRLPPSTTSGSPWAGCSTPSGSTASCGGTDWTRAVELLTYREGVDRLPTVRPPVRGRAGRPDGWHPDRGLRLGRRAPDAARCPASRTPASRRTAGCPRWSAPGTGPSRRSQPLARASSMVRCTRIRPRARPRASGSTISSSSWQYSPP